MRWSWKAAGWWMLTLALTGCPTTFTGQAHVPNGRAGCEQRCKQAGLKLASMVFLGEYSSACVCEVARPASAGGADASAAAAAGAAVGAMEQSAQPEQGTAPTPIQLN